MSRRTWHKGPPPHIGWWNASAARRKDLWRWWNGYEWSRAIHMNASARTADYAAAHAQGDDSLVEWTKYYPAGARVPRINPSKVKK